MERAGAYRRSAGAPAREARPLRVAGLKGDEAVPSALAVTSAVALRLIVVAAAVLLLWLVLDRLLVVVVPLVVAILLTTLLAPPARWLERRGLPPAGAALAVVGGTALLLLAVLALIVPPFVSQIGGLSTSVQEGLREVGGWLQGLGISQRQIDSALNELRGSGGKVAGSALSGAMLVAEGAASVVLVAMLTFFFVKDGARLWNWIVDLFGEPRRPAAAEIGRRSWTVLSAYFRGVIAVATVDAVAIGAILAVVGVPLLVPLIVLTFLAAFFPIVGALAAGVVAVLVALVAKGVVAAVVVAVGITLVQQIEGNVLYPMLVGPRLALHPVAILMALAIGGVIAGVAGAFLAVPTAAVLGAVLGYARSS
jgi:predicted PurR-regulated permease PerM